MYNINGSDTEIVQLKRKRGASKNTYEVDDKRNKTYIMTKSLEESSSKDEYSVFGQLIAQKIRKLDQRNKLIAQHRIHTVLFELEMQQIGSDPLEQVQVQHEVEEQQQTQMQQEQTQDGDIHKFITFNNKKYVFISK